MVDPIELADPRQVAHLRDWLQRTYPSYLGELSEFDDTKYHLTADGHWEPDYLPYWLEHPFCLPLVAVAEGVPVGFAFVGQPPFPYMSASCDFRLCEFFVVRELRRSGLGRRIAVSLLSSKAGAWELVVLPRNKAAAVFWRVVLPLVSTAQPAETRNERELHFAFSTRASSSSR